MFMQCSAGASVAHKLVAVDGIFLLFLRYRHCTFSPCTCFYPQRNFVWF